MIKILSILGFIFITYVIITSGYITDILPCKTQKFLINNLIIKHIIIYTLIFLCIMLEGGWSFNMKLQNEEEVNWSNGNIIDTLIYSLILYIFFLFSIKMNVKYNLIVYSILFIIYLLNTQRLYWKNRDLISDKYNNYLLIVTKLLSIFVILIFIYGNINYYNYIKNKHKDNFNIIKLVFGKLKC